MYLKLLAPSASLSLHALTLLKSFTEVDLDEVEGSEATVRPRDVVVDADFVQWNADEDVVSEAGSAVQEQSNPEEPVELIVPQGRLL